MFLPMDAAVKVLRDTTTAHPTPSAVAFRGCVPFPPIRFYRIPNGISLDGNHYMERNHGVSLVAYQ